VLEILQIKKRTGDRLVLAKEDTYNVSRTLLISTHYIIGILPLPNIDGDNGLRIAFDTNWVSKHEELEEAEICFLEMISEDEVTRHASRLSETFQHIKAFMHEHNIYHILLDATKIENDKELFIQLKKDMRVGLCHLLLDGGLFWWKEYPEVSNWEFISKEWKTLCKENNLCFDGYLPADMERIKVWDRDPKYFKIVEFVAMTEDNKYLCYNDASQTSAKAWENAEKIEQGEWNE